MLAHHYPFVGRVSELRELRAGLEDLLSGHPRLFLLTGEAGIGKTRIADEITSEARAHAVRPVWVTCSTTIATPAYWAFLQISRTLTTNEPRARRTRVMTPQDGAHALAAEDSDDIGSDPRESRFRLFDSFATRLTQAARAEPLIVIIDDFHAADDDSWLLARFIASEIRDSPVMMILSFRDAETSATQTAIHGELCRFGPQLALKGLSETEVREIVVNATGDGADSRFISRLHRHTGGNPFFVTEVARAIGEADAGGEFPLPPSIRLSISNRMRALPAAVPGVLSIAAVIGIEFDVSLLARIAAERVEQVRSALMGAERAGIIVGSESGNERYSFSHALLRDAFYERLSEKERARLHSSIAATLEETWGNDPAHLGELAYHFMAGATAGDRSKAIYYACRAGEAAYHSYAYERAAAHWRPALALLEQEEPNSRRVAELLRKLGETYSTTDFDQPRAIECLERAATLFEGLSDLQEAALVRASLGVIRSRRGPVMNIGEAMAQYQRAEPLLRRRAASDAQALLYIGIAQAATQAERTQEGLGASMRAMGICRKLGNEPLWVLAAAHHSDFLFSRGKIAASMRLAERAWQTADRLNDLRGAFEAAWSGGYHPLGLWDPRAAQKWFARELSRSRLAEAAYQRAILKQQTAFAFVLMGQLEKARELIVEAPRAIVEALRLFYAGDWEKADQILEEACDESLAVGSRNGETIACFFRGQVRLVMEDAAGAELLNSRSLSNSVDGPILPYELNSRAQAALIAFCQGHLEKARGHVERCRQIVAGGEDFRGLRGRAALAEAIVCCAAGELNSAELHFKTALEVFRRHDLKWEEAAAHYFFGEALRVARIPARAAEEFSHAHRLYARAGAGDAWLRLADSARASCTITSRPDDVVPPTGANLFRCDGDFWSVAYRGKMLRLKDSRGMRHIAFLLAHPGQRVGSEHLSRLERTRRAVEKNRRVAKGGGHERASDRARISVTKAIRSAIENIRRSHPSLGRMLATTIRTGHACLYEPDAEHPVEWQIE